MQRRKRISIVIIGLAITASLPIAVGAEAFPRTTVQNLVGSDVVLPDQLEARINILVVGFTQKAGSNTKPWTERLKKDFTRADGFAVYPVAVLAGVPPIFRGFALGSIRGSVPTADRGGFLIVNDDESAWRSVAGYQLPDDPYIIVIDKTGTVIARAAGLLDEKTYEELSTQIRSVAGGK